MFAFFILSNSSAYEPICYSYKPETNSP